MPLFSWRRATDWAPKAMNYVMVIGLSCSTLVLAKWSIAKCSTNNWPLHGQFVLPNARIKLTSFRDVSDTRHMLVTSRKNHSDACLWQPFWQTLARCQIVSQFFQCPLCNEVQEWGPSYSAILAESGPDLWRKGRVRHGLVIWRFTIYRCGWNVAA